VDGITIPVKNTDGTDDAMNSFGMRTVLEFIDRQVMPPTSFGFFVIIEALFLYGLYKVFVAM
jgi:hypothetical protein